MAIICDLNGKKPEISYPSEWEYKIIITKNLDVKKIIEDILKGKEYSLKASKTSKEGKYESYSVKTLVTNEDEREEFFSSFKSHENVKYVL